ncbi:MAG TPA: xanthine dehydrogenase subunit D, partial [Pseudomonas sp.]|nr:xanthine dehydrogenase subunit D [Pseudomonas sp.]
MSTNDFTPRQLNASNFADRWQPRPDAHSKARGEQRYPTDELDWPGLLHGRILRSPYPHAQITGINVDAARKLPGVHAVITAADIPGDNHYGIVFRDQPVFCTDRVRYLGDALAAVAADTPEIAAHALRLIEVQYTALPV